MLPREHSDSCRLPEKPLRGCFGIAESVIEALERWLPTYRDPDGEHEGMALLCGIEWPNITMFMTAIFPAAETRPGFVRCSEQEFARASLAARRFRLGVLAQVHTHPGSVTLHSVGDDDMVRPRYEGMISIVVPHYARFGLRPLHGLGVHQLQDGIWVRIDAASIRERIILVPGGVDLR